MSPVDPARESSDFEPGNAAETSEDPDLAGPAAPQPLDAPTQRALENRYGTGRRNRFNRKFGYGIAGGLVAAGIAFLVFSGWHTTGQVSWQDIGYTKRSELVLDVKFEVTAPASTPIACAVEGINAAKASVGWKVLEVPATQQLTHTITTKLVVTNPAVAATVRECWVVS